jgi:hypothetical protein
MVLGISFAFIVAYLFHTGKEGRSTPPRPIPLPFAVQVQCPLAKAIHMSLQHVYILHLPSLPARLMAREHQPVGEDQCPDCRQVAILKEGCQEAKALMAASS